MLNYCLGAIRGHLTPPPDPFFFNFWSIQTRNALKQKITSICTHRNIQATPKFSVLFAIISFPFCLIGSFNWIMSSWEVSSIKNIGEQHLTATQRRNVRKNGRRNTTNITELETNFEEWAKVSLQFVLVDSVKTRCRSKDNFELDRPIWQFINCHRRLPSVKLHTKAGSREH